MPRAACHRLFAPLLLPALVFLAPTAFGHRLYIATGPKAAAAAKPPEGPRVEKTGEHRYRLGEIDFDAETREIRIPAVVNLREGGPIEYLLVNENGKVHESLLTTKARPLHLQIVLKLLRYRSGEGALFDTFLPEEEQREKIEAGEKAPLGDAVAVTVRWEKAGETRDGPLAPWIFDAGTGAAMTDEPWIVTGSHVSGGTYLAESEGSFIGIYLDQIAILNMSRPGAENDERWGANPAETPEVGQKVAIILKPVTKPGATAQ
ncbi:MAG: hypothetical protein KDM91_00055 [Verrucomicrobiae bacterium]|nr:hypothetical protein [Verrucomicrobiae bacterium]